MGSSLGVAVAFSAGLFSFLSPCVLPLFPSYISFITGMSVGDLTGDLGADARRRVLLHAVAFVVGFSLVFVALGASLSAASQALFKYRDVIRMIGGALIANYLATYVAVGFWLVALLCVLIPLEERELQDRFGHLIHLSWPEKDSLGWTPCVGPILGAILSLAGTAETVARGVGLLMAYSAGLGVPFLLSALALGPFLKFFKRYRPFIPTVERAAGVLLVIVGVLVFTNYYLVLNSWANSITPEWLLKRL